MAITQGEGKAHSRRNFLRLAARTAAVGVGLAVVVPKEAFGAPTSVTNCCRTNCKSCPAGKVPYKCTGCDNRCICNTNVGTCFTIPC